MFQASLGGCICRLLQSLIASLNTSIIKSQSPIVKLITSGNSIFKIVMICSKLQLCPNKT
jgi:hypothetical protein